MRPGPSVVSGANALGPMLGATLAVVLNLRATFLVAGGVFALAAVLIGGFVAEPQRGDQAPHDSGPAPHPHQTRPIKTP